MCVLVALLLLLLSLFSRVQLCATPKTEAHQAPPSLGFSRQEHWSGLPFPSPMHESEKWKWSRSVFSDSQRPLGLQPRLQAPLSMGFSRQEYWSGVPLPSLISRSVMSNSLQPHGLYSLQVSSVYGILQARILEQVAISFSRVQPYCSSFRGGLCYSQKKKKKKLAWFSNFCLDLLLHISWPARHMDDFTLLAPSLFREVLTFYLQRLTPSPVQSLVH